MSNTQFAWLIAPQALLLSVIIGAWTKRRFEHWTSRLRYDCTAHVHDLRVRLDSMQHQQDRILSLIERLQNRK